MLVIRSGLRKERAGMWGMMELINLDCSFPCGICFRFGLIRLSAFSISNFFLILKETPNRLWEYPGKMFCMALGLHNLS